MLENNEADAMLWISSFDESIQPPKTKIPSIILGKPNLTLSFKPDVFIPVGTPGLDHKGHIISYRQCRSLTSHSTREPANPAVSEVLTTINALI